MSSNSTATTSTEKAQQHRHSSTHKRVVLPQPSSSSPTFYVLTDFLTGLLHACNVFAAGRHLASSEKLRVLFGKCLLLNGLLFLGSIVLLEHAVSPLVNTYLTQTQAPGVQAGLFNYAFAAMYYILWLYPVYSLSFIFNTAFYNDIAVESYQLETKNKVQSNFSMQMVVETIYRCLLVGFYVAQSAVVAMAGQGIDSLVMAKQIPLFSIMGAAVSCVMIACLYAFYSFEYLWEIKGVQLQNRLDHFERHWAYYAGFGTPCMIATYFFPLFISNGLWALIFPVFITLAICSKVPTLPPKAQLQPLPIFYVAKQMNEKFLMYFRPQTQ